jgi:hypothetical protein
MIVAGVVGFGLVTAYLLWLDQELGRVAAVCGGPCEARSVPPGTSLVLSSASTGLSALTVAGLVVAAFLAAPLVSREYEQRTNLLVWSQDVPAVRWLAVKGALLAAVAAVLSAVLGFVASGLAHRIHDLIDPKLGGASLFSRAFFEATPAMQVSYALFGFALGLAVSVVARRTLPAMGITLVVFIAVRLLVFRERPYFMPLLRHLEPVPPPREANGDWLALLNTVELFGENELVGGHGYADAAGNSVPSPGQLCLVTVKPGPGMGDLVLACMRDHGAVNIYVDYQPGSRLGTFHLYP